MGLVNLTLVLLVSCVDTTSLVNDLDQQSRGYRRDLDAETRKTHQQLAERRRLQSQLGVAQDREAEIKAGGVTPGEEAELNKVQQEIASLKKQLSALANAG